MGEAKHYTDAGIQYVLSGAEELRVALLTEGMHADSALVREMMEIITQLRGR